MFQPMASPSLLPNRSQSPTGPSYAIHRKPPANCSRRPQTLNTVQTPAATTQSSAARTPSLTSSAAAPGPTSPAGPVTPSSTASSQGGAASLSNTVPSHTGTLSQIEVDAALRRCLTVLNDAVTDHGKRPFSAILLAPDNATVLLTHNSISHFQHAESELARLAAAQYSTKYLNRCTWVSTWEPCAMCAGTIYWTGIGRVLYAAGETKLSQLTGPANDDNMTMNLPCRTVLNAGQRRIEVIGPVSYWEDKVIQGSKPWWDEQRGINNNVETAHFRIGSGQMSSMGSQSPTTIVPNDSLLGTLADDGEYQADLKVDWMF